MTPDRSSSPAAARAAYRAGLAQPTAGIADGFAQANLVSVLRELAYDLLLYTQRNPKPCPVLDVAEPGSWTTPLAPDADLRTDLPRYRVWRHGELAEEPNEISEHWRADLVTFLIGCSFTFEAGLHQAGVPVRHVEQGVNVPMYRTNRPTRPAGRLHGDLVVSMRPIPADQVADAVRVTAAVPSVHGAPVHVGDPAGIGIADVDHPDFGDPVEIRGGEVPVFWACGVTPQVAIMASRPPFAITHAPGHMFLTDLTDAELRSR